MLRPLPSFLPVPDKRLLLCAGETEARCQLGEVGWRGWTCCFDRRLATNITLTGWTCCFDHRLATNIMQASNVLVGLRHRACRAFCIAGLGSCPLRPRSCRGHGCGLRGGRRCCRLQGRARWSFQTVLLAKATPFADLRARRARHRVTKRRFFEGPFERAPQARTVPLAVSGLHVRLPAAGGGRPPPSHVNARKSNLRGPGAAPSEVYLRTLPGCKFTVTTKNSSHMAHMYGGATHMSCRKIYWCEPLLPSFFRLLILEYLYGAVSFLAEALLKTANDRVLREKHLPA